VQFASFYVTKRCVYPLHHHIEMNSMNSTVDVEGDFMPREIIPPAAHSFDSNTIFIVDDDEAVTQFLQQIIEEETPYHTVVFNNGQTALEQAPSLHPCLLLIDYRLPGINGLELYDRLQQFENTRGIPAIMMSAVLPVNELQQRGLYQLRKPMDVGSVIRMITHALASFEESLWQQRAMQEQYR
jgi:two-component system response regulator (stage 0 sporulation protein F)